MNAYLTMILFLMVLELSGQSLSKNPINNQWEKERAWVCPFLKVLSLKYLVVS